MDNDANNLEHEILNGNKIFKAVKGTKLFSEIKKYANKYEDFKNYNGLTHGKVFTALKLAVQ